MLYIEYNIVLNIYYDCVGIYIKENMMCQDSNGRLNHK